MTVEELRTYLEAARPEARVVVAGHGRVRAVTSAVAADRERILAIYVEGDDTEGAARPSEAV